MLTNSLRPAIAAALILVSGSASAAMHSYEMTATVTYSADPSVPVGTTLHANFSYDDAAAPSYKFSDSTYYDFDTFLVADFAGHRVDGDHLRATVRNNADGVFDMIDIEASYPVVLDGELMPDGVFLIHLGTVPYNTRVLPNDKMPMTFNMADWDPIRSYGQLQRDGSPTGQIVQFSIDSIQTDCLKQNGQNAKKICWYR